jgi:PPOX class probable F420-dependent enzyme
MRMSFAAFASLKYLSLETLRKSGVGVRTPIWFAVDLGRNLGTGNARLFVYTEADSGKVKRIRNNGRVRIAPCDMRGKILGDWVDAHAEIVAGSDVQYGMQLLNKKYFPWKQLLDFFAKFRPHERAVIAIMPVEA